MKFKPLLAATLAAMSWQAQAVSLSTFNDNGGVHEAIEYASSIVTGSASDKYTFTLASPGTLEADGVALGMLSGMVKLFKEAGAVDTVIGSFGLAPGSATFASLAAGDYYYLVSAAGKGAYLLESALTAVPEPETYALILAGLGAVLMIQARHRRE
jgi:PEP-CTERM motif